MLIVGVTGGIGSGKTTVSDRFAELGVPVIDTDVIAREVVASHRAAFRAIVDAFGDSVVGADGELDRKVLNERVFSDPQQRTRLENIVHPAIRDEVRQRIEHLDAPYCVLVVPLLVETDFTDLVDRVLVVDADDDRRRRWITARSGLSPQRIEQIFTAQATRAQRLAIADDVIVNDAMIDDLRAKVDELHHRYMEMAQ